MLISTIKQLTKTLENNIKKNQNIKNCSKYLNNYNGKDYKKKIQFNNINYNRLKLFQNNDFEIMLICWNKNQETKIHNHPKNGCLYKVLEGTLIEQRYNNIFKSSSVSSTRAPSLSSFINNNQKSNYIDNDLGIHKIIAKEKSVSLHIYSPPLFYK